MAFEIWSGELGGRCAVSIVGGEKKASGEDAILGSTGLVGPSREC
jgi:hypothetical protein